MKLRHDLRPVLPLIGLLLVAACAHEPPAPPPAPYVALTPTEQFAVEVRSAPDEILLAPTGRLSPTQHAALAELAGRWRESADSPVLVQSAPSGPASATAQAALRALQDLGVPADLAQSPVFDAVGDAPPAPVRVAFSRLAAAGPQCAGLWGDIMKTGANAPQKTFGCATTANLAAQIADPRDLVAPRPMDPSDALRRATVIDKYRDGQPTGTKRDEDERGNVSAAAN